MCRLLIALILVECLIVKNEFLKLHCTSSLQNNTNINNDSVPDALSTNISNDPLHIIFNGCVSNTTQCRIPLIFPGTKWCGPGFISTNNDDLGYFEKTDKCCRTHDHCPLYINPGDSKYNLTNYSQFTRLSCQCDEELKLCLKNVTEISSSQIGFIYFTVLNTKCFQLEYPIRSCLKYNYIPVKKCVAYEIDCTAEKRYQWFDNENY